MYNVYINIGLVRAGSNTTASYSTTMPAIMWETIIKYLEINIYVILVTQGNYLTSIALTLQWPLGHTWNIINNAIRTPHQWTRWAL